MRPKVKNFFVISIALNILLLGIVAWGFFKLNYFTESLLLNDVYNNLVILEAFITEQTEDNWTNPRLVQQKTDDLFMGTATSIRLGATANTLSQDELNTLTDLNLYLDRFIPTSDEEYYSELSEEEKEAYERLGEILSDIDFRVVIDDANSKASIMSLVEEIVDQIRELYFG